MATIPTLRLLFGCRPAAICFLIIPIRVWEAIKRFAFGSLAHVSQEVLEARKPTRAHRNPAASVVFESLVAWIVAASFHTAPRGVCARAPTVAPMAMLYRTLRNLLLRPAAAAYGGFVSEMRGSDNLLCAAIAKAIPISLFFYASHRGDGQRNDGQAREPLTGQVFESTSRWSNLAISHFVYIQYTLVRAVGELTLISGSFCFSREEQSWQIA
jgi:hypothetical protein